MALIAVGVLCLLIAHLFLGGSKRKWEQVEQEETPAQEQVELAEEAASDWGAAATLGLAAIGLIVFGLITWQP